MLLFRRRLLVAVTLAALASAAAGQEVQKIVTEPHRVDGAGPPPAPAGVVKIDIDRAAVVTTSKLLLGVTQTHRSADAKNADPAAAERGQALLNGVASFENTHIMGWGVGPIEPKPGVWDWASMDRRMAFMRKQRTPIVITLCSSPGWMREGGEDWKLGTRILPEHESDFVDMCLAVAKRYPDVRYFQVWNEFKGYWNKQTSAWDVEAYTAMYNKVYDALKANDPSVNVGGFYLVVSGTGTEPWGRTGHDIFVPMGDHEKTLLQYWVDHKHGADFVCVDRATTDYQDKNDYTVDEKMALTPLYEKVSREVGDIAKLPVWWSEFYAFGDKRRLEITGAAYASSYLHALMGGSSVALQWNPNEGELDNWLYSDVTKPDGGQPTPHYAAYKAISEHFARGTEIVRAASSSPWVEVLASKSATLIVNKWHDPVEIDLDGTRLTLKPYEVRLLD